MNNSGTSLSKILNGINNTLNIANKAIPLYQQTKPMIKTVKQTYNTIKNNKNDLSNMIKFMKAKNAIQKDMNKKTEINSHPPKTITNSTYSNINNPKFFI